MFFADALLSQLLGLKNGKFYKIYTERECMATKRAGFKGKYKDKDGYIWIWMPEHPNNVGNYMAEHRLIMEKEVGRSLITEEHVHHINHIRDDNRIENLRLMTKGEHTRLHKTKFKRPSKDLLNKMHWIEKKSVKKMAEELKCSRITINRWMGEHNLKWRDIREDNLRRYKLMTQDEKNKQMDKVRKFRKSVQRLNQ